MTRDRSTTRRWAAFVGVLALAVAGCGGDDDDDAGDDAATADAGTASADAGTDDGVAEPTADDAGDDAGDGAAADPGGGGGGGGGTLIVGDETIPLDSARCFLEEQDAAAGGGKILFVAQGFGANGAGDEVMVDVTRYDEDSQFAGDDITVAIGDPFSGDAVSLRAAEAIGTVNVDGSTLSADGLTFVNGDDRTEQPGSFEINC